MRPDLLAQYSDSVSLGSPGLVGPILLSKSSPDLITDIFPLVPIPVKKEEFLNRGKKGSIRTDQLPSFTVVTPYKGFTNPNVQSPGTDPSSSTSVVKWISLMSYKRVEVRVRGTTYNTGDRRTDRRRCILIFREGHGECLCIGTGLATMQGIDVIKRL